MKSIWKHELMIVDDQMVAMRAGAKVLSVGEQNGRLFAWAIVDPEEELSSRRFSIRGTGHPIRGTEGQFLGTVLMEGGSLVWHVFVEYKG